ncbi:MAG: hypothetical protein M3R65_04710 [Gemmatimonadota bacterium]|nr:hypothetical protein [Gemmatimonadota bacterium]
MSDRRYDEKEVAAIFRSAVEATALQRKQLSGEAGLTLTELQSIGGEVGIPSDAVAGAALTLDLQREATQQTLFGLPFGVARTVELNRWLTDEEWERVVAQLREVFDAYGKTRSEGSSRQWSNGNLRVSLEPTETGHRLRFRTLNASARNSLTVGLALVGVTTAMAAISAVSGDAARAASGFIPMGIAGLAMIANGALRLPKWARLRGSQMESIAVRVALPPGSRSAIAAAGPDATLPQVEQ